MAFLITYLKIAFRDAKGRGSCIDEGYRGGGLVKHL